MKALLFLLACLISSTPLSAQIQWKNPLDENFQVIRGQAWENELKGTYQRLPNKAEKVVRAPIWKLSKQNAGMSIVFRSNAPEIKIRYTVAGNLNMPHMPSTGVSGVDLYATDIDGNKRWCAGKYAFKDTITYTYSKLWYATNAAKGYEYELFLPLYNSVKWLEIGVSKEYELRFIPASKEKPIVLYGTSIAQGACASRPGMAFGNIIGRELEHPVVNLGFSGNGQMEPEVFDLLSEIDAQLFILDNMPNMTGARTELIYKRAIHGIHKLRQKSDAPILLVEHNGYSNEFSSLKAEESYRRTNTELRKVYRTLKEEGIKNLYYLNKEEIGFIQEATVEGVHPSDLGMQIYANAYLPKIREILAEDCDKRTIFTPCPQQRSFYDWKQRHEDIIAMNKSENPDILMIGNSITHYWAGKPTAPIIRGEDSWNELFKGKIVHNLGFAWDRIENALWRIYHGELDGYNAKKVFLLLGTNNLEKNTNDEIIDGINELVRAVRHRQPNAKIYVTGILPRTKHEVRVAILNEMLKVRLHIEEATFIDMSSEFLQPNGKIINDLFIDGLHPNKEGYQRMAKMLKNAVNE